MLLKRFIVLAAGVLLFIGAFIAHSHMARQQMEDNFQSEREKYHIDGVVVTSSAPAMMAVTPPAAPTAPGAGSAAAPDTNTLIGPVPPAPVPTPDGASAPDTNSAPEPASAPATPDTNSAPTPADTNSAPASTMDYPRASRSPFLVLASYRPSDDGAVRLTDAMIGATTDDATPSAAVNPAPVTVAPAPQTPAKTIDAPTASPATKTAPAPSAASQPVTGEGKVIVLLYHQFKAAGVPIPAKYQWTMNVDVFEAEMKYIHDNGYHVIPMSDLLKFLRHEITVPPNSVCITIDDGYKSALVYAAPVLKQYGFPWTFFVYPDFITDGEGPGAASWKDLAELQAEGIDIESHSMTHPNLKLHRQKIKGVWHNFTPAEYADWLKNETSGAKALLEQKLGKPITCFAYPYGEYNTQVEDAAIAAGYEAIFTVADNPVHATTSLHSIGRYTITQGVEKNFAAYLHQGALELDAADPAPGTTISNPRPVITAALGYAGKIDPASIETSVRDFGVVRHDFDPQTNTLRLYLPRDLIQPVVLVNLRVKDAATGQIMVANWHFNYEPADGTVPSSHAPIAPAANPPAASSKIPAGPAKPISPATTTTTETDPTEAPNAPNSAAGTPQDSRPAAAPATH